VVEIRMGSIQTMDFRSATMADLRMSVCRVNTPEGVKDYITYLDEPQIFAKGLAPEAIVGMLLRPLTAGESITSDVFARNRVFVDFMQSMIARRGPTLPGLIAEAQKQVVGWIYVIDRRTPNPQVGIPPEDIIGVFVVKDGEIVPDSYQPSSKHLTLSTSGFFQLGDDLNACLLAELANLPRS